MKMTSGCQNRAELWLDGVLLKLILKKLVSLPAKAGSQYNGSVKLQTVSRCAADSERRRIWIVYFLAEGNYCFLIL